MLTGFVKAEVMLSVEILSDDPTNPPARPWGSLPADAIQNSGNPLLVPKSYLHVATYVTAY